MKYVIFDCDSTVGLPGKPMDDALTLLYLPEVADPAAYRKEMYDGWLQFQLGDNK